MTEGDLIPLYRSLMKIQVRGRQSKAHEKKAKPIREREIWAQRERKKPYSERGKRCGKGTTEKRNKWR